MGKKVWILFDTGSAMVMDVEETSDGNAVAATENELRAWLEDHSHIREFSKLGTEGFAMKIAAASRPMRIIVGGRTVREVPAVCMHRGAAPLRDV